MRQPAKLLSYAILTAIMCFLTYTAIIRHIIFDSSGDLAIYSQFCWLINHHGLLEPSTLCYSVSPGVPISPLSEHFVVILIPLAALYRLIPSPLTLIITQAICAWLFIICIVYIIHKRLSNQFAAIIASIALSLYPPLHLQARGDFHPDAFIMLAIPWLWVGITEQRRWLFLSSLLLALLAKETGALAMMGLGIALLATRQYRKFGAWMCTTSMAWFFTSQLLLHVLRNGKPHPAMLAYYGYLGSNPAEIAVNALRHPSKPLGLLFKKDAMLIATQMLLPLLFLPLIRPLFFVPSLVPFAQAFISIHPQTRNIRYQGMMQCSGLLILGCVEAIAFAVYLIEKRCKGNEVKARNLGEFAIAFGLLSCALLSWHLVSPSEPYLNHEVMAQNITRVKAIREALSLIPENAPVIASGYLSPHLANRRFVWWFWWHNPLRDERGKLTPKWRGEMPQSEVYIAIGLTPLVNPKEKPLTLQQLEEINEIKRWREIETVIENEHIILLRYHQDFGHPE